jgi:hypothetical protein
MAPGPGLQRRLAWLAYGFYPKAMDGFLGRSARLS